MHAEFNETHQFAESVVPRGSDREAQRRRNAAARRKLEALRERKLLLKHLTDVWDEPGNRH
jgi:hypothetical protein